jgi:CheY-like chemotaxis protein
MSLGDIERFKGKRILVIEDIPDTLAGMVADLRDRGFNLTSSQNVTEALNRLEDERFDLILLDWRLPIGDENEGLDDNAGSLLLERLKTDEKNPNHDTPVVVITAEWGAIDRRSLQRFPAFRCVVGKFDFDMLTQAIESSL